MLEKFKKNMFIIMLFTIFILQNNVSAITNLTNNKVKLEYDSNTKQLYAYGYNKQGNLGTGNIDDVSIENKVNINSKINDQKIVDYAFTDSQTYLLTDSGKIYATGFKYGNGYDSVIFTSFKEIKLYKRTNVKVTSISVKSNGFSSGDSMRLNDKNAKSNISIVLKTSNKYISYNYLNELLPIPMLAKNGTWNQTYLWLEKNNSRLSSIYFNYHEQLGNKYYYDALFTSNGKLKLSTKINENKKTILKNTYYNGTITSSRYMGEKQQIIKMYKNNSVTLHDVYYYKNLKNTKGKESVKYQRYTTKIISYTYKANKTNTITVKNRVNNKLVVTSKKVYYRNKNGELKSNKHGKAYSIITYYKSGKVTSKIKYLYNSAGKVNKTIKLK